MTLLCFTSSSWQLSNCIPCISSSKVFECNLRCKKFPRFYFLLKYHRSPTSSKRTKPTLPSCMVHTFLTWYGSCVQGFFFPTDARCVCVPSPALPSLPSPPSGSCMDAGSQSEHHGSRNRSTAMSLCCPEKCSLVWVSASAAWGRVGGRAWTLVPLRTGFTQGQLSGSTVWPLKSAQRARER